MNWNQDQIAAIIGTKELEIIGLRMQLAQALEQIKELTPKPAPEKPQLEVVDGAS